MSRLGGDYQLNEKTSWISSLSYRDHMRLRDAVRRVHLRELPEMLFSPREADRVIEALGPKVAEKMIKALVDGKLK